MFSRQKEELNQKEVSKYVDAFHGQEAINAAKFGGDGGNGQAQT